MNYTFTSRPANEVWLNARYRQYQFDDQTPAFLVVNSVSYDYSAANGVNMSRDNLSFTRHTFDGDASYSPIPYVGIRGGYTYEKIDRLGRFGDSTTENTGRVSLDMTGVGWLQLRGIYENSKRVANGVDPAEIAADGEQPGLGQYDITSRNRQRYTALAVLTPISNLSFNASAGRIKDDYPDSQYGLQSADNNVYSIGFDAVPVENKVVFGFEYGYEKNNGRQASHYAAHVTSGVPPTWSDPRADWWNDTNDKTNHVNASVEVIKMMPKTDVKFGYDWTKGETAFNYTTAAGYTQIGQPAPVQVPTVLNDRNMGTFDVLYCTSSTRSTISRSDRRRTALCRRRRPSRRRRS
jgi:hypothetical protein